MRGVYVLDGCQGSACRRTAGRFLDEILIAVYRGCAFEIEGSQILWPLTLKMLTVDDRVDVYYFAATKRSIVGLLPSPRSCIPAVESKRSCFKCCFVIRILFNG